MRPKRAQAGPGSGWLWPREHGAYAEVFFPLGTALALGRPTLPSVALCVAIITAFLAHEPALILLGARGGALQREAGARARAQGSWLGVASLAAGALGLAVAAPAVLWSTAALLPVVGVAVALTLSAREKSLPGETLIGLLLAFAAVPVSLGAGSSLRVALQAATAWSVVFLIGTATVHALLARKKRGAIAPSRAMLALCALLSAAAVFCALSDNGRWPMAATPMLLVSAAALLFGLPPKRLKLLGWAMLFAHLATAVALCGSLRVPASALPRSSGAPIATV